MSEVLRGNGAVRMRDHLAETGGLAAKDDPGTSAVAAA
jgi:hypothetical protein